MGEYQKGGKGNEPFWKSRRVMAAMLSLLTLVAITAKPEAYEIVSMIATAIATCFGLTSWIMPKK